MTFVVPRRLVKRIRLSTSPCCGCRVLSGGVLRFEAEDFFLGLFYFYFFIPLCGGHLLSFCEISSRL